MLAFSRQQLLRAVDLDLNDLITNLVKMLERVIGEHVEIDVVPGAHLSTVRADPGQVEQVLVNLCVNARDAMPNGGAVTIRTENVTLDQDYCSAHPWAEPGRYVRLSVTDTGAGMDAETLAHAFDPFFTTKEVGKGTGLGLATVYGIVSQHDGLIHADSEPGEGSTFSVYLPVVDRPVAEGTAKPAAEAPRGSETILVAEDDEAVRKLTVRVLQQAGYDVLIAADGAEALQVFDERDGDVHLALLDVGMPKISGADLWRRIRDDRPNLRCLFSSGYAQRVAHAGLEGMAFIQKPYGPGALLRKVRDVLDA